MTVYFIGAGPGDPELITVKGQRLIRSCPVIIYAGSLVPQAVLDGHRAEQVINSAELHLEQIIDLIKAADAKGDDVARVHSGDPSLYGAIGEQIRCLRELGIALLVFGKHWALKVLGAAILLVPHIFGAPQPLVHSSLAPEALESQFKIAAQLTNLAFWLALGVISAWLFRRKPEGQYSA